MPPRPSSPFLRLTTALLASLLLGGPIAIYAAVTIPNTFVTGEVATAASVNANFSAVVDAINAVACPGGFASVTSQGRQLGCIQQAEQSAQTWFNASYHCWSTHGGRLATVQEWILSIRTFELLDPSMALTSTWGNWEWAADYGVTQHSNSVVGFANNTNMTGHFDSSASATAPFRCFIDRR